MHDHGNRPSFARLAAVPAWMACGLACLAALGYLTGDATLLAFQPGWKPMSPLNAIALAALALPLMGIGRIRHGRASLVIALCVGGLGLAVLASHALFQRDLLNPALTAMLGIDMALAGKTSVATSLCMMMLGSAVVARRRRVLAAVEWPANATLLIAGSALLGYAYDISDLYEYYIFNSMALPTAMALFCLAVSLLLSERESRLGMAIRAPYARGSRVRRMLALTVLPAVAGWALLNVNATAVGGDSFAMALLVMCTSVPMFYLLLEYGRASELLDRARAAQERAQQAQSAVLQEQVARITAQLADTHRSDVATLAQLERAKRSEVVAQLSGSIAHDFNNMLMVIGGSAQLLKLQMPAGHALMRHVDKISNTVAATARLTAQLAAFSRTQRLAAEPFVLDEVVRSAIDDNAFPADVRVVQQIDAANAWVLGDRAQLQLALSHILRNAGEAVNGHGTLRISTRIGSSETRADNDRVLVRIEDDGCGMSPDVRTNATEPFFTTKADGKHQGLGLAQAAAVVHQASGSLVLQEAPGGGTRVDICLPRHLQQARAQGQPERVPTLASTGNRRLLVIDDDAEVRSVIAELLRSMHYEVFEAPDGETGLRKLQQLQPALAIVDYLMPGMNGSEVARRARQQFPALPILFMSGYADSAAIATIPRAQLLRKPILPQELEHAVAATLALA
jgi:signal transduction histidine kinase